MDYDSEIRHLAGETLAIQRLLIALCTRLATIDAGTEEAIRNAFDETASLLEDKTIELGETVPPEHLAHSVRVIEEMRTATFGNKDKPKHAV
jgi:hypothetical protein